MKRKFSFRNNSIILCSFFIQIPIFASFNKEKIFSYIDQHDNDSQLFLSQITNQDEEILKQKILNDENFSQYLSFNTSNLNLNEFFKNLPQDNTMLMLLIKNTKHEIIGLLSINEGIQENQFNIGYWIYKEYRGNGYAHLAASKLINNIWNFDRSISFEFWIDDNNQQSVKTLEKICSDLKINKDSTCFIKHKSNRIEILAQSVDDKNYAIKTYFNNTLQSSSIKTKEELLTKTNSSEEQINSGKLKNFYVSMYIIKNPDSQLDDDAEFLYHEIIEFLKKYQKLPIEKFDKICTSVIKEEIPKSNLLKKENFNVEAKGNMILWRGCEKLKYAEKFRRGDYFLSCWNVRGTGIYTTTSLECAKNYSNKKHPSTLIEMFIKQDEVKILEDTYLEKIKNTIIKKHPNDFGEFKDKNEENYIFDNLKKFTDEYCSEMYKKIDDLGKLGLTDEEFLKKQQEIINEYMARLKKDSTYKKLNKNRKKYYTSAKAYVWFNSGLLTKLMRYDVLHAKAYLRDFYPEKEDEYLVVNPKILHILI